MKERGAKMVKKASSSSPASPVTITVSATAIGGSRSMGITSPVPRTSISNSPSSPLISRGKRLSTGSRYCSETKEETDVSSEYVSYTVQIPPTPDHQSMSHSQASLPGESESKIAGKTQSSFISGTIFTGGFNCVTRGHIIEPMKSYPEKPEESKTLFCGMPGCDGKALREEGNLPCLCRFRICRECYLERIRNGEKCPGCKEEFREVEEDVEEESLSEAEDQALPLPTMKEPKLEKRLSVVRSFKAPNHPPEFDHARWLYETKGTYGYGNAVWPKEGYTGGSFQEPPDFEEKSRRPLTRKTAVSTAILSPYRYC